MKRLLAALILTLAATSAYAYCRTHTYIGSDGQMITCTTCCTGSHCTTTCI